MTWRVPEIAQMTDGVGFTLQQPAKAEIVAFVFRDEPIASKHIEALERAVPDVVTITVHK